MATSSQGIRQQLKCVVGSILRSNDQLERPGRIRLRAMGAT